ncbi:hypothetical protein OF83DRAFT_1152017 [Amylostereum chailletii]|nr:hypothetical protein OF83DRAFT_1152017 [Amylostereum chailletii]
MQVCVSNLSLVLTVPSEKLLRLGAHTSYCAPKQDVLLVRDMCTVHGWLYKSDRTESRRSATSRHQQRPSDNHPVLSILHSTRFTSPIIVWTLTARSASFSKRRPWTQETPPSSQTFPSSKTRLRQPPTYTASSLEASPSPSHIPFTSNPLEYIHRRHRRSTMPCPFPLLRYAGHVFTVFSPSSSRLHRPARFISAHTPPSLHFFIRGRSKDGAPAYDFRSFRSRFSSATLLPICTTRRTIYFVSLSESRRLNGILLARCQHACAIFVMRDHLSDPLEARFSTASNFEVSYLPQKVCPDVRKIKMSTQSVTDFRYPP